MASMTDDPYLWLEDITCENALDWVRQHNEPTLEELCDDRFERPAMQSHLIMTAGSRSAVVSPRMADSPAFAISREISPQTLRPDRHGVS
jgi:prolyl oligopeptidase